MRKLLVITFVCITGCNSVEETKLEQAELFTVNMYQQKQDSLEALKLHYRSRIDYLKTTHNIDSFILAQHYCDSGMGICLEQMRLLDEENAELLKP